MTEATSRGLAAEPIVQQPLKGVEARPAMSFAAPPKIPAGIVDQQAGSGRAAPPTEEERASVMAARHKTWAENADGATGATEEETEPVPPHEDVEAIEMTLPSGKVVEYGPRRGSNLSWDVAALMGDQSTNGMLAGVIKVVLCIRSIDGKAYQKPGEMILAKKIANMFDERDLDTMYAIHGEVWPPLRRAQLPLVKKIFR